MKDWRRFLQWRLSTLLILACTFCVLVGWQANTFRKQRNAIAWLNKLDCEVHIEYSSGWLYPLVRSVNIEGGVDTIEPLAGCPYLESVHINPQTTEVVDKANLPLKKIVEYPTIETLEPLSGLPRLDFVSVLTNTPIELGKKPFSRSLRIICVGSPYAISPTPLQPSPNLKQVMFYRSTSDQYPDDFTDDELELNRQKQEQTKEQFERWQEKHPNCNFVYSW